MSLVSTGDVKDFPVLPGEMSPYYYPEKSEKHL